MVGPYTTTSTIKFTTMHKLSLTNLRELKTFNSLLTIECYIAKIICLILEVLRIEINIVYKLLIEVLINLMVLNGKATGLYY